MKALVAALVIMFLAGCSSEDTQKISQDAKSLAEHTGQAMSGMTATAKVKFMLAQRKSIDMDGVEVSVKDGVATLTGKVKDAAARDHIETAVGDIRGIDKVDDLLKVGS